MVDFRVSQTTREAFSSTANPDARASQAIREAAYTASNPAFRAGQVVREVLRTAGFFVPLQRPPQWQLLTRQLDPADDVNRLDALRRRNFQADIRFPASFYQTPREVFSTVQNPEWRVAQVSRLVISTTLDPNVQAAQVVREILLSLPQSATWGPPWWRRFRPEDEDEAPWTYHLLKRRGTPAEELFPIIMILA